MKGALQVLQRNPMLSISFEDGVSLLNYIEEQAVLSGFVSDEAGKQSVSDTTFLYKRLERQQILRGFGCIDGSELSYPERSLEISPQRMEEVTGLPMASLTPKKRTTYWQLAGISVCVAEYFVGTQLGIDPLYTLIPVTMLLFGIDQIFFRGASFESVYQKLVPEYRKKIIYHEAGHFLLAYLLGVPIQSCVTNARDAQKYKDIKGQAGTIFFDAKLADEMQKQRVTRSSLDRLSVIIMAGIAAEALAFGQAEGGAVDEQQLISFFTTIQPPWNLLRIQGQARWSVAQAVLLIKEHKASYDALVAALEQGKVSPHTNAHTHTSHHTHTHNHISRYYRVWATAFKLLRITYLRCYPLRFGIRR